MCIISEPQVPHTVTVCVMPPSMFVRKQNNMLIKREYNEFKVVKLQQWDRKKEFSIRCFSVIQ